MADEEKVLTDLRRIDPIEEHVFGIPFFVATTDGELPKEVFDHPMCYVLTGNGLLLVKSGAIFSSASLVTEVIGLGEVPEKLLYSFTKIPEAILKKVAAFFYWAAPDEAMVLPYYNSSTGEWMVVVPEQQVTAGSIDYELSDEDKASIPDGFTRIGSWHSHGNGSAYHSSIDHHDEEKDDGIHITFGSFGAYAKDFTSSVSLMADGTRWMLETGKTFDIEEGTLRVVSEAAKVTGSGTYKSYKAASHKEWIEYPKEARESWAVSEDWKSKVKRVVVKTTFQGYGVGNHWSQDPIWPHGSSQSGSVSGSGGYVRKDILPDPNSLYLCPDCDGCGACTRAVSFYSIMSVFGGRSPMFTKEEKDSLDMDTSEGREAALRLFFSRIGKPESLAYKDFDLTLSEEEIEFATERLMEFYEMIEFENLDKTYPRLRGGDADTLCLDPNSLMFAKPVHKGFFCLRLHPRSYSKAITNGFVTDHGYVDFSSSEDYQMYARTNGNSFYSKLPNAYITCADCDCFSYTRGCIQIGSPYYDIGISPTGCEDLAAEMQSYPTCILFEESELPNKRDFSGDSEECQTCKYFEVDLHGVDISCLRTGDPVESTDTCLAYERDPNLYNDSKENEDPRGTTSIVATSKKCYDCQHEVYEGDHRTCLIYADNADEDAGACPFFTRLNMIEG